MLTVGDKIYCYWLSGGGRYTLGLYTVKRVDDRGFRASNDVEDGFFCHFFYDNNFNDSAKYLTTKQLRKNKINKIYERTI